MVLIIILTMDTQGSKSHLLFRLKFEEHPRRSLRTLVEWLLKVSDLDR